MATTDNSIGPFWFVELRGQPIPPQDRILADDRPGVDGTEFTLAGKHGPPFSLVSSVDAQSYPHAHWFLTLYKEAIAAEPLELVQAGVDMLQFGYLVKVVNVEALDIRKITGATGYTLNPPSEGWIVARWDLIAIPQSTL